MGAVTWGLAGNEQVPDGYVGHVRGGVDLQIVDENRAVLPAGAEGHIRVRTPELAQYATAEGTLINMADADGWYYPGDIGRIGADGSLLITGRSSELINRGGVIVAPEAIEEVLRLVGGVRDVAVVGITNQNGVEEIWAAVVADGLIDEKAILAAVRPQLNEKTPDRVLQVGTIPRAESAKPRRLELQAILKSRAS